MNVFRLASTTGLRYDYSYCIISIICWVSFHCFRFCSVLAKEKEIYLHYYTRKIICRKVVMPLIRIEFTPYLDSATTPPRQNKQGFQSVHINAMQHKYAGASDDSFQSVMITTVILWTKHTAAILNVSCGIF